MEIIELENRYLIASFLQRDTPSQLYALADLDDFFWPQTTWYGGFQEGKLVALCLLLKKQDFTILSAICTPEDLSTKILLKSLSAILPQCFFATIGLNVENALEETHHFLTEGEHIKMVLHQFEERGDTTEITLLGREDFSELEKFYEEEAYTEEEKVGRFFYPYMLELGPYMGIRRKGKLICAGGVHVASQRYGVVALGNIATRPDCRGQGLGRKITSALCKLVKRRFDKVGLNVKADNQAAIQCYQKIGFREHSRYVEGVFERFT